MSTDSIVFAFSKDSSKDFGKKKRANRSAKLKQCKLDARREQWLSQVKNKGSKDSSISAALPTGYLLPLIIFFAIILIFNFNFDFSSERSLISWSLHRVIHAHARFENPNNFCCFCPALFFRGT